MDVQSLFGSSESVSDLVNGKRGAGEAQATALVEFFKVSLELGFV